MKKKINKFLEKMYIKFRMFFLVRERFWDKFDYYEGNKGMSLRESYLRARYMAGYNKDSMFCDLKTGGIKYE